jgi:SAM-dependent methyltransferase
MSGRDAWLWKRTSMTEGHYFAADTPDASERERMALLGRLTDPSTILRLTSLGVGPGWRCLDVGAGDGSVARWLAGRVGPRGRVVATDLNPRFLAGHGLPNLEVRRHDILKDELEAAHYDLIHCRAVLMHLADPLRAVERMAAAVRPGGWLLLEEFDFGSFRAAEPGHPRAGEFNRRMGVILDALRAWRVIDVSFGRRVSDLLEREGLMEVGREKTTPVSRGAGPGACFAQMWTDVLRTRLVGAGVLTEADFDELHRAYDDRSFTFFDRTLFRAWGRRPG